MKARTNGRLVLGAVLLAGAGLAGCGSSPQPAPPVSAAPATSNLAGNWLLAGSLPEFPFQTSLGTELSVTFSTVGNQIVGSGQQLVQCPVAGTGVTGFSGFGGGFVATGTAAADGSFMVQSPATNTVGVPIPSVSITGKVPGSAGGSWSGSYTISMNGDGGCTLQTSASLTAQAIGLFSGTYVATGSYVDGTTETPVTISLNLQQGTTATLPDGTAANQAYVLNGTMTATGIPCFHTGTMLVSGALGLSGVGGTVDGTRAYPAFRMDDGSLAVVDLVAADVVPQQLDQTGMGIAGGNCASTQGRQVRLGNFTRQN